MHPLTVSYFLLLLGKFSLHAFLHWKSTLSCPCFNSLLSCQGLAPAHLNSLPLHNLVIWTCGSVFFPLPKATLALLSTVFFMALRPLFLLLLSNSGSVLATMSFFLFLFLPQTLAETVFSLLYYQATMGRQTLVFLGKRCR